MIKIVLCGACGRMGKAVAALCEGSSEYVITAGVDVLQAPSDAFPVYAKIGDYDGDADVVIDFSHPGALPDILAYCLAGNIPAVLATTGYSDADIEKINAAAEKIPIFRSGNYSLGISVLANLTARAAAALAGFDIEIVEAHHAKKLDAPSGTALMLAEAAASARPDTQYIYDRHSVRRARDKREIGISSIRGGTIIGEHEVIFAGSNEVIKLCHSAQSREVFAVGALKAAGFVAKTAGPGLHNMDELVSHLLSGVK